MTNFTNKNLDFLSDEKLINILNSILDELEIVIAAGAYRSTTYLAVSAIEGLFRRLIDLLRIQPKTPEWPQRDKKGNFKALTDLSLFEMENILAANGGLPQDFENLYNPLRNYRNYMHPKLEIEDRPINQSIGFIALACLDALIELYSPLRFVAGHQWRIIYGLAQVPENSVIHMPHAGDHVSLLVSEKEARTFQEITFRVIVSPGTVFNFVYNYFSPDKFMAARIEGRPEYGKSGVNGRLVCTKWRSWFISGQYIVTSEPDPQKYEHIIRVVLNPSGNFSVIADQQKLELANVDWGFNPAGKVGFMTELGLVSILDLEVKS
jgi:hypothetical protein